MLIPLTGSAKGAGDLSPCGPCPFCTLQARVLGTVAQAVLQPWFTGMKGNTVLPLFLQKTPLTWGEVPTELSYGNPAQTSAQSTTSPLPVLCFPRLLMELGT